MSDKSLHNTTANGATKNVKDINFWGKGDMFRLLCKASSEEEGWMKSTKAMEIPEQGCVIQITTQQRNPDGSYSLAEAVAFVPNVKIAEFHTSYEGTLDTDLDNIPVTERKLVPMSWSEKQIMSNK